MFLPGVVATQRVHALFSVHLWLTHSIRPDHYDRIVC